MIFTGKRTCGYCKYIIFDKFGCSYCEKEERKECNPDTQVMFECK